MNETQHFSALENMYLAAPINRIYNPTIVITEGRSEIEIELSEGYFHSTGAVHGSVYFKMLDDAAFFAVNSLEQEVFVLTASFTTYITRPVSSGIIKSVGSVATQTKSQFIAESIAYNSQGQEVGRGNGMFIRGKHLLKDALGYERQ